MAEIVNNNSKKFRAMYQKVDYKLLFCELRQCEKT